MRFTSETRPSLDETVLRALMPEDERATRSLVATHFARTRYEARVLEQLECALGFEDPEYMAMLALSSTGAVLALILFGAVAGARAVTKLHVLIGSDRQIAHALLEALHDVAERAGERLIVCELPDDAPFKSASESLAQSGYVEDGRIDDFVSDGIALRLLVRRLERSV